MFPVFYIIVMNAKTLSHLCWWEISVLHTEDMMCTSQSVDIQFNGIDTKIVMIWLIILCNPMEEILPVSNLA